MAFDEEPSAAPSEEEIRQRILREREAADAERVQREKELEEESVQLDKEIEAEIRGKSTFIVRDVLQLSPRRNDGGRES